MFKGTYPPISQCRMSRLECEPFLEHITVETCILIRANEEKVFKNICRQRHLWATP